MKKGIRNIAFVVTVASVAATAGAQTGGPTGISARIGAQFPRVDDTTFAFGLSYKLANLPAPPARNAYLSYISFEADYYGRDSDRFNIPLAVAYNVRSNNLVFTAGIGVDIYRRGRTEAGLGGQIGVAYEFGTANTATTNPFFVQAKYFFANETELSGVGIYIGYRF